MELLTHYKTGYIFLYTKKFKVAVSILKLVAGVGFEPTMLLAYETGVVTGPYPQYTLAERLRLELRNPLSRVDGLAIHSNTIMGPFLNF